MSANEVVPTDLALFSPHVILGSDLGFDSDLLSFARLERCWPVFDGSRALLAKAIVVLDFTPAVKESAI